jgi:arylformamidase
VRVHDVTVPVRNGMPVFEGDPAVALTRMQSMDAGAICDVSRLDFGVHTGTHIDAPSHFIPGAPSIERVPLDAMLGPAVVVDATGLRAHVTASDIGSLAIDGAERVLFKTANSALWGGDAFSRDFIALLPDAAAALVEHGVRLVGIDYLSVAPFGDPRPTHVALLRAGVVILEGLDLRRVNPGAYTLTCLPLLIDGSDGAPARVVLSRP